MNKIFLVLVLSLFAAKSYAQSDSIPLRYGTATVFADPRMDMLESRFSQYFGSFGNKPIGPTGKVSVSGYRLMLLNSSDRDLVMRVRTQLLQAFPDQKPYIIFQQPFLKLKFGDFLSRAEADRARKQIISLKLFTGNIYILSEKVTVDAARLSPPEN